MTESWYHFTGWGEHYEFTAKKFESVAFPEHLKGHDTIPCVWLETGPDAKSALPSMHLTISIVECALPLWVFLVF